MAMTAEWDVYVSGALNALTPEENSFVTTEIYERVKNICQKIRLTCYLSPKSQTTPSKHTSYSKIWENDYKRVVNSGVLVAYVGIPSCGVGVEIEMARTANVPVILLFESEKQADVSRLVLGNPAVKYTIPFNKAEDIDNELSRDLILAFSEKNLNAEAFEKNWPLKKQEELRKQVLSIERSLQNGGFFRHLINKPVSQNEWFQLGKEWDKKNIFKTGKLDDFS
jgi:hypothetical protein